MKRRFSIFVLRGLAILAAALLATSGAFAVEPDELLADPALEARARSLSGELRCLVCQNQSIDDSNAGLARDLRLLVRERLVAGDSDEQVRRFLVARYGEFVLLAPPFGWRTLALWLAPLAALLAAALAVWRTFARSGGRASGEGRAALSREEEGELKQILDGAGEAFAASPGAPDGGGGPGRHDG